jgi:hypothetical protein
MKLLFSVLLLLSAITPGMSQEPTPADCQLTGIVQVDGREEEWPMKWLQDEDKKFFYNVCTDESSIYVRMKVKEDLTRRKLALFGLTLWIDPNGKKKKKLGLRFPTGAEAAEVMAKYRESMGDNPPNMSASQRADFQKQMDKSLIENLEMMELIGLTDEPLTSTRSGITNGLKVAIAQDEEGAYVYEAIIPFRSYRLSKASITSLGIGFETGKYVPPKVKPKAGTSTADANAPGLTSQGYGNRFSAANMTRGQGYKSQGQSTPMSYAEGFWTTVNLKK